MSLYVFCAHQNSFLMSQTRARLIDRGENPE